MTGLTDNLDDVDNDGVQERVILADITEKPRSIGEDELHPGDLLTTQDPKGANEPPPIGRDEQQVPPPGSVTLVVRLGLTGGDEDPQLGLSVQVLVVLIDGLESSEGLVVLALLGQPSRGFGHEEE